jgi:hypothetical protein
MPEYRFYKIRKDGRINGPAMDHICPDDGAAVVEGEAMHEGNDVEIWQGSRVVAYVIHDIAAAQRRASQDQSAKARAGRKGH